MSMLCTNKSCKWAIDNRTGDQKNHAIICFECVCPYEEKVDYDIIRTKCRFYQLDTYTKEEKERFDSVEYHKKLCEELNRLYNKKNKDYGDSFHETFIEEGMAMARIRLGDKYRRFCNLTKGQGNEQQQVKDESVRDTLLDLANYAIMTVIELDNEKSVINE